jgi:hypothetical protein
VARRKRWTSWSRAGPGHACRCGGGAWHNHSTLSTCGRERFLCGCFCYFSSSSSYFPPCAPLLFVSVLLVVVLCIYRLPRESAHSSPTSHHITASPHRPGLPAPAYANAAHPSRGCFCHTRVPALGAVLLLSARLISPTLHRVTRPTCARSGSCSRCRRASQH